MQEDMAGNHIRLEKFAREHSSGGSMWGRIFSERCLSTLPHIIRVLSLEVSLGRQPKLNRAWMPQYWFQGPVYMCVPYCVCHFRWLIFKTGVIAFSLLGYCGE